jgi:hypothetical protein
MARYNLVMFKRFGTGPMLRDVNPLMRDEKRRHEMILLVSERDSVIEGLPPFTPETRRRIADQLKNYSAVPRRALPE